MTVEEMIDVLDRAVGYLGEHNKLGSKVAEIRDLVAQLGWHPASELPSLDKNGNSQDVIVICTMNPYFDSDLPRWSKVVNGIWGDKDVKWWCYPPQND